MSIYYKRHWRYIAAGLLLFAALDAFAASAASERARMDELKAQWVSRIATFASWPEAAATSAEEAAPILIGVIDQDPIMNVLRTRAQTKAGLSLQGRKLQIIDFDLADMQATDEQMASLLRACHLLFLPQDGLTHWLRLKPIVEHLPVVTISEIKGFASLGGHIELEPNPAKKRRIMIVNLDAMRRSGVSLSANILSLKSIEILRDGAEAE